MPEMRRRHMLPQRLLLRLRGKGELVGKAVYLGDLTCIILSDLIVVTNCPYHLITLIPPHHLHVFHKNTNIYYLFYFLNHI